MSISLLLSEHLPSSLTVQRLPNSEHHVAGIRCINGTHPPPHSLQKQQPAAASVLSDLLNLPHFNHDSAPLLSSRGSLARIPKPPAASSQHSSLSGVSRPVSQPARRGLELRKGRKEGGKKTAFSIDGPLFIYITSNDHSGDPLSRDAPSAETRGLERQTHPDTVKHTVSSSRRLN